MRSIIGILPLLILSISLSAQNSNIVSARNYLQYEELDKAKQAIDNAIEHEKTKNSPKAWLYRGKIYLSIASNEVFRDSFQNALIEAFKSYTKIQALDKKHLYSEEVKADMQQVANKFYNNGYDQYYNKQAYTDAFESFGYAIQILPNDTNIIFSAALAADKAGKYSDSKKLYHKLIELEKNDYTIYQLLARLYSQEQDYEQALSILLKGRKLFPANMPLLIDELDIYLQTGKINEQIDKLEKASIIDSLNTELHIAIGNVYENLYNATNDEKYLHKAENSYKKAVKFDPEDYNANFNLGILYYNQAVSIIEQIDLFDEKIGKDNTLKTKRDILFNKALPNLNKVLEIMPDDINTLTALSKIYAIMGDTERADKFQKEIHNK